MPIVDNGLPPENIAAVALIGVNAAATLQISFHDSDCRTVLVNGLSESVTLTIGTATAKSLAQHMFDAGYALSASVPGIPDNAVGATARVLSGSMAINQGGDTAGAKAGGTGLVSALYAPSGASVRQVSAGSLVEFGRFPK
jgi:hypothetical protein